MSTAPLAPGRPAGPSLLPLLAVVVVGGYLAIFIWGMDRLSYDVWGGLLVAPVLFLVTLPLLARAARREDDPRLGRLLIAALAVKMLATVVRYIVVFDVYEGVADAAFYHRVGEELATAFKEGDWSAGTWELVGTGWIQRVTGVVYAVIGPTQLGAFFVFSWLGFWGLYFFHRAFSIGVPGGDRRRYAVLVFFLPSLAFWPSSVGKEAWMTFSLGLTALGAARLLSRRPGGFWVAAAGLTLTALVRPHLTLIAFVALAVGYLLRRGPRLTLLGPAAKAVGALVLVAGGIIVVGQVEEFFGLESLDNESINEVLEETNTRSSQGGSRFDAPDGRNPLEFPMAAVTVLFRPFPQEAHNAQALAASLEGGLLLLLGFLSSRRLALLPRLAARRAYVVYALAFVAVFVIAFSNVANFGILARQRVQVLPFLILLLALPSTLPESAGRDGSPARVHA